ncbi:MAG: hypothetical protein ACFHVJ_19110 [Aestuariibacter sp.]
MAAVATDKGSSEQKKHNKKIFVKGLRYDNRQTSYKLLDTYKKRLAGKILQGGS